MLRILPFFALALAMQCCSIAAFQSSISVERYSPLAATRREVVEAGALSSMATCSALTTSFVTVSPQQVLASGGATAGGAYLLSVRLRSN